MNYLVEVMALTRGTLLHCLGANYNVLILVTCDLLESIEKTSIIGAFGQIHYNRKVKLHSSLILKAQDNIYCGEKLIKLELVEVIHIKFLIFGISLFQVLCTLWVIEI